ncbi:DUF1203 domain-containing protein [Streptomyces sp.]|uniref:DUF1203 domain-containing protein n=1 Tax=Streptomyces sp. TaxID=1931 RepID=UPI0039C8FC26
MLRTGPAPGADPDAYPFVRPGRAAHPPSLRLRLPAPGDSRGAGRGFDKAFAEAFADPGVALVHVRAVEYGCLRFEVRRQAP